LEVACQHQQGRFGIEQYGKDERKSHQETCEQELLQTPHADIPRHGFEHTQDREVDQSARTDEVGKRHGKQIRHRPAEKQGKDT
jgi:hypothetical protein